MQSNTSSNFSESLENQNSINIVLKNLRETKYTFSRNNVPPGITIDMLKNELDCEDLRAQPEVSIGILWNAYYVNNFTQNMFGFYIDPLVEIKDKSMLIPIFKDVKDLDIKDVPHKLPYDPKQNPFLNLAK